MRSLEVVGLRGDGFSTGACLKGRLEGAVSLEIRQDVWSGARKGGESGILSDARNGPYDAAPAI